MQIDFNMRTLIFIILVALSVPVIAQNKVTVTVTESMDTTIWFRNRSIGLLEIDFTGLSASTDSLWVGYSNDQRAFCTANEFPIVLSKSTYKIKCNGTWRYRIGTITVGDWPGLYVAIRYKVVDSAADDTFFFTTDQ